MKKKRTLDLCLTHTSAYMTESFLIRKIYLKYGKKTKVTTYNY